MRKNDAMRKLDEAISDLVCEYGDKHNLSVAEVVGVLQSVQYRIMDVRLKELLDSHRPVNGPVVEGYQ